jgi:putative tricarboxylic transport membrane protein
LIATAGFPLAACVMFACVAHGFGSRRSVIDIAIGLVLGVVVFVGFNYGLGLSLPAGILSGLL